VADCNQVRHGVLHLLGARAPTVRRAVGRPHHPLRVIRRGTAPCGGVHHRVTCRCAPLNGLLRPGRVQVMSKTAIARLPGVGASPAPRPGYVSRPHLVGRLIRAQATIALIAAPAGYGKTTLAMEWDGWDARQFAWVTLSAEHDRSEDCFAEAVEQAMDEVVPQ